MIGVFDSGVGGLTVIKKMQEKLPGLSFIYLGDNARTPYGNRSRDIVIRYGEEDVEFLISRGAKAIIIACNTASALAGEHLKNKYKLPIFEVITPAAEEAVALGGKRIAVIGTRATINSGAHRMALEEISPDVVVLNQSCPLFVPLVEENWVNRPEAKMVARRYLTPLKKNNVDSLILGCTHYPLLRRIIQDKVGRRVKLIDPAEAVVNVLSKYVSTQKDIDYSGSEEYFATDTGSRFQEIGSRWLGKPIEVKKAEL